MAIPQASDDAPAGANREPNAPAMPGVSAKPRLFEERQGVVLEVQHAFLVDRP
jgi:hypothetical protein